MLAGPVEGSRASSLAMASSLALTPPRPRRRSTGAGAEDTGASLELAIQSAITGIIRYEEDDPALLYNGVPFTQTVSTWSRPGEARASRSYAALSRTLSDTVSLTFDGGWVGVGFLTDKYSGLAEVFIDGESKGVIDTYSRTDDVASRYYDLPVAGTHTISVTVLDASVEDSVAATERLIGAVASQDIGAVS